MARASLVAGPLALLILWVSPAQAAYPGQNGRIAAGSESGIYTMNPDGSDLKKLTDGKADYPTYSADGKRIVFANGHGLTGGPSEIWVMNADGSDQKRLTMGSDDFTPSFSPDGTRIAYADATSIHVMNSDGTGNVTLPAPTPDGPYNPVFSPDGTKIYFTDFREANSDGDIYVMNLDGSNQTNLTNVAGYDDDPDVSPDGKKITFFSGRDYPGFFSDLYTADADGSHQTRVTFGNGSPPFGGPEPVSFGPSFSPDGTRIVFYHRVLDPNGTEQFDIWTMNVDGSDLRNLTPAADPQGNFINPSWQPIPIPPTMPGPGGLISTGTSGVASDTIAPGVSRFGVTNTPFVVGGGSTPAFGFAARRRYRKGTTFRYTLSEAATVRIVIFQRRSGRRRGIRCVAPRRSLRKKARCTRFTRRGTLVRVSRAGANRVPFSGRIGSRALRPGSYSATITATDAAKNTSGPKTISFTIVKR